MSYQEVPAGTEAPSAAATAPLVAANPNAGKQGSSATTRTSYNATQNVSVPEAAPLAPTPHAAGTKEGNPLQVKILLGTAALGLLGNVMIWFQAGFLDTPPHTAPRYFALLLATLVAAKSGLAGMSRGATRSFSTVLFASILGSTMCDIHYYFHLDANVVNRVGAQASDNEMRTIKAGVVISAIAAWAGFLSSYADFGRVSVANLTANLVKPQGLVSLLSSGFLLIGSFVLWALQDLCTLAEGSSKVSALIAAVVILFALATSDPEARDVAFFLVTLGLLAWRPIFADSLASSSSQTNAKQIYRGGFSLIFIGASIYILGTIATRAFASFRLVDFQRNKLMLGVVAANFAVAIAGGSCVWAGTEDALPASELRRDVNYFAAAAVFVALFQLLAVVTSVGVLSLISLILTPRIFSFAWPLLFSGITGVYRSGVLLLCMTLFSGVALPVFVKVGSLGAVAHAAKPTNANNRNQLYIGLVFMLTAWLGLTYTDQLQTQSSGGAGSTALLTLTGISGFIGLFIVGGVLGSDRSMLKVAFLAAGSIFFDYWPWALGAYQILDVSTVLTFLGLIFYPVTYLAEIGDASFASLGDREEGALEAPLAGGDTYEPVYDDTV